MALLFFASWLGVILLAEQIGQLAKIFWQLQLVGNALGVVIVVVGAIGTVHRHYKSTSQGVSSTMTAWSAVAAASALAFDLRSISAWIVARWQKREQEQALALAHSAGSLGSLGTKLCSTVENCNRTEWPTAPSSLLYAQRAGRADDDTLRRRNAAEAVALSRSLVLFHSLCLSASPSLSLFLSVCCSLALSDSLCPLSLSLSLRSPRCRCSCSFRRFLAAFAAAINTH